MYYLFVLFFVYGFFFSPISMASLPPPLDPIDFDVSEMDSLDQPACELLLEEGGDLFWKLLPKKEKGVAPSCESWEDPIVSYVHREEIMMKGVLNFIVSLIDENRELSLFFKPFEVETPFIEGWVDRIAPMVSRDSFDNELMIGWLYDGVETILDNSALSYEEASSLVWKVATCSPSRQDSLEPVLMNLCRRAQKVGDLKGFGQSVFSVANSYGKTLLNEKVPEWSQLTCRDEISCPNIEEGTFNFFKEHEETFKVLGACGLNLYGHRMAELCTATRDFGIGEEGESLSICAIDGNLGTYPSFADKCNE